MPKHIHDFKRFPELTNSQMDRLYFESPHKQIFEDFEARVVKVHDGDTITLRVSFRNFDFPLRLLDIDAPELNEGGKEAKNWLEREIERKEVEIRMNRNQRVGKFGRLLGKVMFRGLDMGNTMMHMGLVVPFGRRKEGELPNLNKELRIEKWL